MAADTPLFTILLPIVRPPVTLRHAVRSVCRQTERRFELVILCDGAPAETVREAERLAATDSRISVAAFPKGRRFGEEHRAKVVAASNGRLLAQIADDDLWFDDHLAILAKELARVDFAHTCQVRLVPEGFIRVGNVGDLADHGCRTRLLNERWNFFGPTQCAYRRSAYDALPEGWAPGPEVMASDANMWRKFLRQPGLRFATIFRVSSLKFGAGVWQDEADGRLAATVAQVAATLEDPVKANHLRQAAEYALMRTITWSSCAASVRANPATGLGLGVDKALNTLREAVGLRLAPTY